MKTSTFFSALALASAAIALPQQAPKAAPSYEQEDNSGDSITSHERKRPDPYNGNIQQKDLPQVQGSPHDQNEVNAVPGTTSGSKRRPRPESYGQGQNVNVNQGGVSSEDDDQDENQLSPQQNTQNQQSRPRPNNNGMMQGQNGPKPQSYSNNKNDMQPGRNQFSPQQNTNNRMSPNQVQNGPRPQPYSDNSGDMQPGRNQFSPQQNTNNRMSPNQGQNSPQSYGNDNNNNMRPGQNQISPQSKSNSAPSSNPSQIGGQCISQQEANQFVRRFIGILNHQGSDIGDAESTAEQIIADDFLEISSSINTIRGESEGNPDSVFAQSGEEWRENILQAPPFGGIETLKVLVFCDQVVWYWNFAAVGSGQFPVKGFNLFTLRRGGSSGYTQGQGRPSSGLSDPGPASGVPSGSSIQCIKLEVEFDSLANALDTGFQCTNRDGEQIQTTSSQGGAMGGMANFQNNRPQGQSQQGGNFQSFRPQSSQGGQPGRGNSQSLQNSQQLSGAGRNNFEAGSDADNLGQAGGNGQSGATGVNGRLNANANSLAGQANGGNVKEADSTTGSGSNQRQSNRNGRGGAGPQDLAALQQNEQEQRNGRQGSGNGVDGN